MLNKTQQKINYLLEDHTLWVKGSATETGEIFNLRKSIKTIYDISKKQ